MFVVRSAAARVTATGDSTAACDGAQRGGRRERGAAAADPGLASTSAAFDSVKRARFFLLVVSAALPLGVSSLCPIS